MVECGFVREDFMPYEIVTEDDGQWIVTRYYGRLTISDLRAAHVERFLDPEKVKKYKVVWSDYLDVDDVSLSDFDVRELASIYRYAFKNYSGAVIVAVMSMPYLYEMGRQWYAYTDGIFLMRRIVRTKQEAYSFVTEFNIPISDELWARLSAPTNW